MSTIPLRYSSIAIVLHWTIATLILFNLAVGFVMEGLSPGIRGIVLPLHISAGMTVLCLTAIRVFWRLTHAPPPLGPATPRVERDAAHIAHFLLYAGMILMPLTGWGLISAHPPAGSAGALAEAASRPPPPPGAPRMGPPRVWGLLALPPIKPIARIGATPGALPAQAELHETLVGYHTAGGWIMIALVALHVAGALKHQILDREPELERMLFRRRQAKLRETNQ